MKITKFQIPERENHPAIDSALTRIYHTKGSSDYSAIRLLSKCKPENDFTRLCQAICIDGAASHLSGTITHLL
jgi:hypothetical protein